MFPLPFSFFILVGNWDLRDMNFVSGGDAAIDLHCNILLKTEKNYTVLPCEEKKSVFSYLIPFSLLHFTTITPKLFGFARTKGLLLLFLSLCSFFD